MGWLLLVSIKSLASFRCLKSVEQLSSFVLIRMWIFLQLGNTSRYSPLGPPVIRGNIGV
ncbi:hypothetical protein Hdeb2414_s0003g00111261 [Helianthus debilis subsp. tardiflorus]